MSFIIQCKYNQFLLTASVCLSLLLLWLWYLILLQPQQGSTRITHNGHSLRCYRCDTHCLHNILKHIWDIMWTGFAVHYDLPETETTMQAGTLPHVQCHSLLSVPALVVHKTSTVRQSNHTSDFSRSLQISKNNGCNSYWPTTLQGLRLAWVNKGNNCFVWLSAGVCTLFIKKVNLLFIYFFTLTDFLCLLWWCPALLWQAGVRVWMNCPGRR